MNKRKKEPYNKEKYQARRLRMGKPINVYRERNGYILSNDKETLYFKSMKEIAERFNMNVGTVMYRITKAKHKTQICGYDVDEGL